VKSSRTDTEAGLSIQPLPLFRGAYSNSRKSPVTRKAGPDFADPDYDLAVDWLVARDAIEEAQQRHDDPNERPRILVINGSSRNEHTCPGEMSKS